MAVSMILLFCLQAALFNQAWSQSLPCDGKNNPNISASSSSALSNLGAIAGANIGTNLGPIPSGPMTITSATFTPINDAVACQAGLPGATVTEMESDLKFGDVTLSGDLPIGGTIKVCGCFPVFGWVGVDGVVPSVGTAVANGGCTFPAQAEVPIPKPNTMFKSKLKPTPKVKSCDC